MGERRAEQIDKDLSFADWKRWTMDCYIMKNRNWDTWHLLFKADMARCRITDMPDWKEPEKEVIIQRNDMPKWEPATIDDVFADVEEEIPF